MVSNKEINNINKIIEKYNLGKIEEIELLNSSQNNVYKVLTKEGIYIVKEYSKDAISNYYYLRKRKEQIRISKILNDNGINTVLPIEFNNKYFILSRKKYYLIYNYIDEKVLKEEELTVDNIKTLASIQSKIHKLDIKSTLPCDYKKIKIDFDKYLKISKRLDNDLYETLINNIDKLNDLINKNNVYLNDLKNNLCISHNDYKLLNILWKNNELRLIDFDATGDRNPTCCLCESAFVFSKYNDKIKYDYYKEYLKTYIKSYGKIKDNFHKSLYVAMNGKIQWLSYLLSNIDNDKRRKDIICMINELILYYNNIDKMNQIYLNVSNKQKDY